MDSPLVADAVVRGRGVGFPVEVAGLVDGAVQIKVEMASFEGMFPHDFMAMERTKAHVVMQDELINCFSQLLAGDGRVDDPIVGIWPCGLIVQYGIMLGAPATPPFVGANISPLPVPENHRYANVDAPVTGNETGFGNPGRRFVIFFLFRGWRLLLLFRQSGREQADPSVICGEGFDNSFCPAFE